MLSIITAALAALAIITRDPLFGYGFMAFATVIGISYIVDILRWSRK